MAVLKETISSPKGNVLLQSRLFKLLFLQTACNISKGEQGMIYNIPSIIRVKNKCSVTVFSIIKQLSKV